MSQSTLKLYYFDWPGIRCKFWESSCFMQKYYFAKLRECQLLQKEDLNSLGWLWTILFITGTSLSFWIYFLRLAIALHTGLFEFWLSPFSILFFKQCRFPINTKEAFFDVPSKNENDRWIVFFSTSLMLTVSGHTSSFLWDLVFFFFFIIKISIKKRQKNSCKIHTHNSCCVTVNSLFSQAFASVTTSNRAVVTYDNTAVWVVLRKRKTGLIVGLTDLTVDFFISSKYRTPKYG